MTFTIGHPDYRKDHTVSIETRAKLSKINKGRPAPWVTESNNLRFKNEEDHPRWKGDKVGYVSLHKWVLKHLGTPSRCEHCKSEVEKRYEWANVSGDYKRDLMDWIRLCRSCHITYDMSLGRWGAAKPRTGRSQF